MVLHMVLRPFIILSNIMIVLAIASMKNEDNQKISIFVDSLFAHHCSFQTFILFSFMSTPHMKLKFITIEMTIEILDLIVLTGAGNTIQSLPNLMIT